MDKDLTKLLEQFNALQTEMQGTLATQAGEIKNFGETSTATAKQIEAINARLEEAAAEMKAMQADVTRLARPSAGTSTNESIGARFVASDQYREMLAGNRTSSGAFEIGSFRAALISGAPALGEPHRVPGIVSPAQRVVRLRDVLNVVPTTSASIEYISETGFVNAAAARAEGGAAAESTITYALVATNVKTLSHFVPATREVLADVGQVRNAIDGRLTYGLTLVEEQQILFGNGTGANLQGITTTPGVQTYEQDAGESKVEAIRKAIVKAAVAEYPVDAVILNPADFADIELTKGTDGHFVWVSVADGGAARLWRVPVIESNAMPAGEALLGSFALGCTLYDREAATVRASDSHASFFVEGKVALLAEERLALAVERPEAFVKVTFA